MSAFSNGFEFDRWAGRWCMTCSNDAMGVSLGHPHGDRMCPIVTLAMAENKQPAEWTEVEPDGLETRYSCSVYEPREPTIDARTMTSRDSARWTPDST